MTRRERIQNNRIRRYWRLQLSRAARGMEPEAVVCVCKGIPDVIIPLEETQVYRELHKYYGVEAVEIDGEMKYLHGRAVEMAISP